MKKQKPKILLLTGLGVNHRFLAPYKLYARMRGWQCDMVDNSTFATNNVKKYVDELKSSIDQHDGECILIGFSLGGIASAYLAATSREYNSKIKKIYTICSPLQGANDLIVQNQVLQYLIGIPIPDDILPNMLVTLRELGREFTYKIPAKKIGFAKKVHNKVTAFFHRNDMIAPAGMSYFDGMNKVEIPYSYSIIPRVLHHHIACADPRLFLRIFKEIRKEF